MVGMSRSSAEIENVNLMNGTLVMSVDSVG